MRKIIFAVIAIILTSLGYSQLLNNSLNLNQLNVPEQCRAMDAHTRLMNTSPEYVANRQAIEQHYEDFLRNPQIEKTTYTIPVVVHVIYTTNGDAPGDPEYITDAQIQSAIDNLNDAYSNQSPYTGANTDIQFCLAQRDASGNPTTGIVRVSGTGVTQYSSKGICDAGGGTGTDNETAVKALSKWDNTKYYNFWIVSEINDNNGGAGTQGYAYFPGAGSSVDGAVVMYNSFGYDPGQILGYNLKTYTDLNVTTIHEVGHALNLYHTFEGDGTGSTCPTNTTCSTQGDRVCDTPPHKRSTSSCVADGTSNSCLGGSTAGDYQHNFMDYSSDDCQTEFTAGQITRMQAVMTGTRASLTTSDGCNPVYTNEAGIFAIVTPTSAECGASLDPVVTLKNTGSATLTSITITYDVDGGSNQTYNWTGSLTAGSSTNVTLATQTLGTGSHTFTATSSLPNGAADPYTTNDSKNITFNQVATTPASSCSVTTTNTGDFNTGIIRVQFATIDNVHDDGDNDGTQNFVCSEYADIDYGTDYTLTVTTGTATEYCRVYIDYDDDGSFTADEIVLEDQTTRATSHITTVSIPAYPEVTGKMIRMRVISDYNTITGGCAVLDYGEVEDYGLNISTPPCVAPVLNSSPVDAGGCSGSNASFSCSVTGPSLTYQWKVSTDYGFSYSNVSNGGIYSGATTNTLNLTSATTGYNNYYYVCYVSNGCGNVTSNAAVLSILASPTASCNVTTTNSGNFGTGIIQFEFNTINNAHDDNNNDGTQDFICTDNTSVAAGSTHAFTLTGYATLGGSNEYARIYIDYNDNGTFEAGEIVYNQMTTKQATHSGNITIPTTGITTGKLLRMRVMTNFGTFSSGCPGSISYGEVEDYGVYIPCVTPSAALTTSSSRCDAGTVTLLSTPGAGTTKWYDASSGGNLVYVGNSYTTGSLSSTTTYYAESFDVSCAAATRTPAVALIGSCTKLTVADCGRTINLMDQLINYDAVASATNYQILVEGPSAYSQTFTRGNDNTNFRMSWFSGLAYNTTYTVKVKARVGGVWGSYGDPCNITTPASQFEAKLTSESCGNTLTAFEDVLEYRNIYGATNYEIWVQGPNSYSSTLQRNTNSTTFRMSWFSGLKHATTYTVKIKAYVNGSWGAYGASCNITTPAIPLTQLIPGDCGTTLGTYDQILEYGAISGATNYEIWVQGPSSYNTTMLRNTNKTTFRLSWFSGLTINTTYSVKVRSYINGIWSAYGAACNVTTTGSVGMSLFDDPESMSGNPQGLSDLSLDAYPNPNSGEFTISAANECSVSIVNEIGQLIRQVDITKDNNYHYKLSGLKQGVYFVIGTVDNNLVTRKVFVTAD